MRKKNLIYLAVIFLSLSPFFGNTLASVVETGNLTPVSIQNYVVVASEYNDSVLTRTLSLKIQNTGNDHLYNIKATLIHITSNGTILKGIVSFPELAPGAVLDSVDTIQYTIDTSLTTDGIIQYTWQIEYSDSTGEIFVNEAMVEENI